MGEVAFLDEGEGPAVLLLHGLGATSSVWRGVLPALASTMRVIAPDLPSDSQAFDPRSWAARVRELLERLEVGELAIVGHGAGGVVAALLARETRVRCLVLIDAGPVDPSGASYPGRGLGSSELAELDVPTLIVWGEDDPYLPPDEAHRLAEALPRPTLVLLPGCSHFLPEEAPDTVGPLVAGFLRVRYLHLPHAHDHVGAGGPVPIELHRTPDARGQA